MIKPLPKTETKKLQSILHKRFIVCTLKIVITFFFSPGSTSVEGRKNEKGNILNANNCLIINKHCSRLHELNEF